MKALSESRFLRFFTFSALYFAQGVPWGFISVGYIVLMADNGLSNDQVGGALSLAYLPWSFKWLIAPVIDGLPIARWGFGRRRPYIVLAEFLMGATLFYLALLGDLKTQLPLVTAVLFAHNVCAALQDVAVDALAVDVLAPDERGRANSFMWASKVAGVATGGGGGVYFAKLTSWPALMMTMAVLMWIVMLVPLFVPEHRVDELGKRQHENALPRLRDLTGSFSFAAPLLGFLVAFVCPFGFAMLPAFSTRMQRADLHFSDEQIALLTGVLEPGMGAIGALIGGVVADKLGTKQAMALGIVVMAVLMAVFAATPQYWPNFTYVAAWSVVFYLFNYVYQASSLGFFMTLANPTIGATHFALYMATANLCYSATAKVGGYLADHIGYVNTYYVAAAIQLASVAILPFVNLKEAEARFHGSPVRASAA